MAYFPSSPRYGKDAYGNDVPMRDKHGNHMWTKAVDTDEPRKKSTKFKASRFTNRKKKL